MVEAAPSQVVLDFSEAVETALGAIRVFAADGSRVDDGSLTRPSAVSVATALRPGIPDGTYTVAWRVVSADSHPLHGAYVFHVGAPGADPEGLASEVLAADQLARSVSVTFTTVRFLTLGLTLFTVGGVVALVLVLTAVAPALRRTLLVVLACTAAALGLVSLFGILLQGAEASGLGIGEAFDPSLLRSVLETRFGQVSLGRAAIAAALVRCCSVRAAGLRATASCSTSRSSCASASSSRPPRRAHANVSGALSFVADVVHVQAAAIWVGGLALVVLALLLAGGSRRQLAADAVPRFSQLALVAVAALLVAGIVNGYLQVRTWSGLWETSYGRLLLVKVALLVPLLALGAYNRRRSVPRLEAGARRP